MNEYTQKIITAIISAGAGVFGYIKVLQNKPQEIQQKQIEELKKEVEELKIEIKTYRIGFLKLAQGYSSTITALSFVEDNIPKDTMNTIKEIDKDIQDVYNLFNLRR